MVSPTQVAPALATITQAIPDLPRSAQGMRRWGWLAGIGALLLVGVVVISVIAVSVFNNVMKPDGAQTLPAQVTNATGEKLALTEASQKTEIRPPGEDQPTSTLFTTANKPSDIPVMPGAKDLQVMETTQGDQNMLMVYFTVDAKDAEIIEYYEKEMKANGWVKSGNYSSADSVIVYFEKSDRMAMLIIAQNITPRMVSFNIMEK